jgi:L-fucose isomerase-like protein
MRPWSIFDSGGKSLTAFSVVRHRFLSLGDRIMNSARDKTIRKQPLLGLCPIGKFVFSHEDASRIKGLIQKTFDTWDIRYVDLESVLPDGMVRDQAHVEPVVRFFQDRRIDALFIPHCNFGTEGAAAMIAKKCGVPTLLWGPRDEAPLADGARLRDSLCGMLATSGVLNALGVPFTYIENCRIDDELFHRGVDRFVRAARVVKTLKTMRIGQIGQRIDFFWSTIVNEADLLQRFGVQVLPIDLVDLIRRVRDRLANRRAAYQEELASFRSWVRFNHFQHEDDILANFALRDLMIEIAQEQSLDGFCIQSFNSIPNEFSTFLSFGCCLVDEAGYPVAPESDLYGAISSVLLEAASDCDGLSFLPDITIRHPENDNAVLLWHIDAPLSLRVPNSPVKVDLPWILKGLPTGLVHFKLKDGPLTVCRFAGSGGRYCLGYGEGRTVAGPYTQEFYTWMEVDDWPTWERQLIEGPYIHHCSCCYGRSADALEEAARYIPDLQLQRFGIPTDIAGNYPGGSKTTTKESW